MIEKNKPNRKIHAVIVAIDAKENILFFKDSFDDNNFDGFGNKMETVMNESSALSMSALSNAEYDIQEAIRLLRDEISDLELENSQYNSKISYCRQEIKRIEDEEAAEEAARNEALNRGGVI